MMMTLAEWMERHSYPGLIDSPFSVQQWKRMQERNWRSEAISYLFAIRKESAELEWQILNSLSSWIE